MGSKVMVCRLSDDESPLVTWPVSREPCSDSQITLSDFITRSRTARAEAGRLTLARIRFLRDNR